MATGVSVAGVREELPVASKTRETGDKCRPATAEMVTFGVQAGQNQNQQDLDLPETPKSAATGVALTLPTLMWTEIPPVKLVALKQSTLTSFKVNMCAVRRLRSTQYI